MFSGVASPLLHLQTGIAELEYPMGYGKLDAGQESAGLIEALAGTRLPVTRRWASLARR